jgi:hypothetical protein
MVKPAKVSAVGHAPSDQLAGAGLSPSCPCGNPEFYRRQFVRCNIRTSAYAGH